MLELLVQGNKTSDCSSIGILPLTKALSVDTQSSVFIKLLSNDLTSIQLSQKLQKSRCTVTIYCHYLHFTTYKCIFSLFSLKSHLFPCCFLHMSLSLVTVLVTPTNLLAIWFQIGYLFKHNFLLEKVANAGGSLRRLRNLIPLKQDIT